MNRRRFVKCVLGAAVAAAPISLTRSTKVTAKRVYIGQHSEGDVEHTAIMIDSLNDLEYTWELVESPENSSVPLYVRDSRAYLNPEVSGNYILRCDKGNIAFEFYAKTNHYHITEIFGDTPIFHKKELIRRNTMASTIGDTDEVQNRADRDQLLALLRKYSFEAREVTLASGRKSNFYIDCKQTTLRADGMRLVGGIIGEMMEEDAPEAMAIGGIEVGAIPIAVAVAMFLSEQNMLDEVRHTFFVRKEQKGHGTGAWVEGLKNLNEGEDVVIVEDVITTGASTIKAIAKAREAGLNVILTIALVDREEDNGMANVREHCPNTVALFNRGDFVGEGTTQPEEKDGEE